MLSLITPGLAELLDWWKSSPTGLQIVKERQEQITNSREQAAAVIASAQAQLEKAMPPLLKDLEAKKAKLQAARNALRKAQHEVDQSYGKARGVELHFRAEIDAQQSFLRKTADSMIDDFIREMRELHAKCDKLLVTEDEDNFSPTKADLNKRIGRSNWVAVQQRAQGIIDVIQQAEALKRTHVEDLAGELGKLRESLPSTDKMTETKASSFRALARP